MGLYGILTTSIAGLSAQADRIGTVADNIANVSTHGYKRARTEFSTLVPEERLIEYTPGSVQTHVLHDITEQGAFDYTKSVTDLAINGGGFFAVSDLVGRPYLTRAGAFTQDPNGNLVNAAGFKLLGVPINNVDDGLTVNSFSSLQPVDISTLGLTADPSTAGTFQVNLPSNATAIAAANLPSANAATAAYTGKSSLISYDNLGNEVTVDYYFAKTGANTWQVAAYDKADAAVGGGFPYSSGALATTTLTFDGTTGNFTPASPTTLAVPIPNGRTLTLDLAKSTQLATDYVVRAAQVNGNAPASVQSLEITNKGLVYAIYSNGARVPSYRIPLANVASPNNLQVLPGNVFAPTEASGDVQIGGAATASFGKIVSNALEKTTVDLATELTTMIEAQRSYSANSKVFETGSELLDIVISLKR